LSLLSYYWYFCEPVCFIITIDIRSYIVIYVIRMISIMKLSRRMYDIYVCCKLYILRLYDEQPHTTNTVTILIYSTHNTSTADNDTLYICICIYIHIICTYNYHTTMHIIVCMTYGYCPLAYTESTSKVGVPPIEKNGTYENL
jgi:hypothetical protein